MSTHEVNPGSEVDSGLDATSGLPGNAFGQDRDVFGQPLSKAPTALGSYDRPLLRNTENERERATDQTDQLTGLQTKPGTSVYGDEFESGIPAIDRVAHLAGQALNAVDEIVESSTPVVKQAIHEAATQISEAVHHAIDTAQTSWHAPDNALHNTLSHRVNQVFGFFTQKLTDLSAHPDVREATEVASHFSRNLAENTRDAIQTAQSTTEAWVEKTFDSTYINPSLRTKLNSGSRADSPFIGVIDTGFNAHSHGTQVVNAIQQSGHKFPDWLGDSVGTGHWAESLVQFVEAAKDSGRPGAIVNLSFDLTQINPDGSITTRHELTDSERTALTYARAQGVLIVVSSGNQGGVMSALGQASQQFDNIITVGASENGQRADYSSYGQGLNLVTSGHSNKGIIGTSLSTAKVTAAALQVWEANAQLDYRQVIHAIETTAIDLQEPGWDQETGAGQLNTSAAIDQVDDLTEQTPVPLQPSSSEIAQGNDRQHQTAHTVQFQPNRLLNGATPSERPAFWDSLIDIASDAADTVTDVASDTYNAVSETVTDTYDTVTEVASDTWDTVSEVATDTYDSVSETLNNTWDSVSETVSKSAGATVNSFIASPTAKDLSTPGWNSENPVDRTVQSNESLNRESTWSSSEGVTPSEEPNQTYDSVDWVPEFIHDYVKITSSSLGSDPKLEQIIGIVDGVYDLGKDPFTGVIDTAKFGWELITDPEKKGNEIVNGVVETVEAIKENPGEAVEQVIDDALGLEAYQNYIEREQYLRFLGHATVDLAAIVGTRGLSKFLKIPKIINGLSNLGGGDTHTPDLDPPVPTPVLPPVPAPDIAEPDLPDATPPEATDNGNSTPPVENPPADSSASDTPDTPNSTAPSAATNPSQSPVTRPGPEQSEGSSNAPANGSDQSYTSTQTSGAGDISSTSPSPPQPSTSSSQPDSGSPSLDPVTNPPDVDNLTGTANSDPIANPLDNNSASSHPTETNTTPSSNLPSPTISPTATNNASTTQSDRDVEVSSRDTQQFGARGGAVPLDEPNEWGTHRGAVSRRSYRPDRVGQHTELSTERLRVTSRGIERVEQHLSRFDRDEQNERQIARLREYLTELETYRANPERNPNNAPELDQRDLNFYAHELRESVHYRRLGYEDRQTGRVWRPSDSDEGHDVWNDTHTTTLEEYGHTGDELYHPSTKTGEAVDSPLGGRGPDGADDDNSSTLKERYMKISSANRKRFMREQLKMIKNDKESHPLKKLLNANGTGWIGRDPGWTPSETEIGVHAGHLKSRHGLEPGELETFALEDGLYNLGDNYGRPGESGGTILEKTALNIGGIPVEKRTAEMYAELGYIDKTIVENAPKITGWVAPRSIWE